MRKSMDGRGFVSQVIVRIDLDEDAFNLDEIAHKLRCIEGVAEVKINGVSYQDPKDEDRK